MTKLLQNGADSTIADAKGRTPIDVASPTAKQIFELHHKAQELKERRAMNNRAAEQAPNKPNKADEYHQQFADQIVEQIRQGNAPWQKPWKPGEEYLPKNLSSGKEYRGGNSIYLSVAQGAKGFQRQPLGNLQADTGGRRPGPQGRARHPHPVFPGSQTNLCHRQIREARSRRGREESVPLRTEWTIRWCGSTPCSMPIKQTD